MDCGGSSVRPYNFQTFLLFSRDDRMVATLVTYGMAIQWRNYMTPIRLEFDVVSKHVSMALYTEISHIYTITYLEWILGSI